MTIKQITDQLQRQKPHQYTDAEIAGWLSDIEGEIYATIVQTHANPGLVTFNGIDALTPDTTEMIAPNPYDRLYLYYLMMQVDLHNQELDKYNNSARLFNEMFAAFSAFWHRTYMPGQNVTHFYMGGNHVAVSTADTPV